MGTVLAIFALVGLVMFVLFTILWMTNPARRVTWQTVAIIGLLIWAVVTIIQILTELVT